MLTVVNTMVMAVAERNREIGLKKALGVTGFVFGEHWEEVRAAMRPFDIPIAIVLLILFGWYVYRHVHHFKEHSGEEEVIEAVAE